MWVVRYLIPGVVCVAGFVMFAVLPSPTSVAAGSSLLGAGLAIALLNLTFRVGAKGDEERRQEDEARDYFTRHGRWPD
jgi:hypothetical protein